MGKKGQKRCEDVERRLLQKGKKVRWGGGSSKKNKAERKERSVVSFREKLCNDVLTYTPPLQQTE